MPWFRPSWAVAVDPSVSAECAGPVELTHIENRTRIGCMVNFFSSSRKILDDLVPTVKTCCEKEVLYCEQTVARDKFEPGIV